MGIHTTGDLYGYDFNPLGPVVTGRGVIGKRWGQISRIFSVGDFDGDGVADLLAINRTNATLYIYQGLGNGKIGEARRIGAGWGGFIPFTADIDRDGLIDLCSLRPDGQLFWYRNKSTSFEGAQLLGSLGPVRASDVQAIGAS